MTKRERHKFMQSEARRDRRRGFRAIMLSKPGAAKSGGLLHYFQFRQNFWEKVKPSMPLYNFMKGLYDL